MLATLLRFSRRNSRGPIASSFVKSEGVRGTTALYRKDVRGTNYRQAVWGYGWAKVAQEKTVGGGGGIGGASPDTHRSGYLL